MAIPQIDPAKQGKHIPGHPNFSPERSRLTHPVPQALADAFAGRGQPVGSVPRGRRGFRERIDFGEVIGEYIDEVTGMATPTTKGMIHFDGKGRSTSSP